MRLSLLQRQENAHDDSVWAAAWSPTDNTLVTGSVDESVKLWRETGDTLEQVHHLVSQLRFRQGTVAAA
jgi:WD repeat-containing protein 61